MRLTVLTLVLCTCKPAPAPEPTPAEPAPPPLAQPAPPPVARPAEQPVEAPAEPERCKCPAVAADDPPDTSDGDDEDDEFAGKRRARAKKTIPRPLAAKLRAAFPDHRPACDVALSGPCNLRGDLDGDGAVDDVVLVRARNNAGGLAILYAAGAAELLGAGRRDACWTTTEVEDLDGASDVAPCPVEVDANLSWISRWELRPRALRDGKPVLVGEIARRTVDSPAPGAVGDGLLLSGGDAAAALYRTATGWVLMHLGY